MDANLTSTLTPSDIVRIQGDAKALLEIHNYPGWEKDITRMFIESAACGQFDERIPHQAGDKMVTELSLPLGRADIVLFHRADRSISVIEVKDGTKGHAHVVAGIGQACLYASQLKLMRQKREIRKCLLWTSVGEVMRDSYIEAACEEAGVIAMPWAALNYHLAIDAAVCCFTRGRSH